MLINGQKVPRFGGKYQFRDSKSSAKDIYSQISNTKESESEVAQSSPTLCDPVDCSPPGSSIHGILQARILEWVAISFSNAWKWKVKVKSLSQVRLLATPWTAAHQAPPSMGFSRQEYWSGVPLPSPSIICRIQFIPNIFCYTFLNVVRILFLYHVLCAIKIF